MFTVENINTGDVFFYFIRQYDKVAHVVIDKKLKEFMNAKNGVLDKKEMMHFFEICRMH